MLWVSSLGTSLGLASPSSRWAESSGSRVLGQPAGRPRLFILSESSRSLLLGRQHERRQPLLAVSHLRLRAPISEVFERRNAPEAQTPQQPGPAYLTEVSLVSLFS